MGLSGFLGRRNIQEIEIAIETPEEIYDSTPFVCIVRLINKKKIMPSFLIRGHLLNSKVFFPFTDANSSSTAYLEMKVKGRGLNKIDNIAVCSVFPFNFFVRCRTIKKPIELILFPAPLFYDGGSRAFYDEKNQRGETSSDKVGFDGDMLSIRNYAPGDPFKFINWKATAKTGHLKTKELSSLIYEPVIVDLDDLPFHIEKKLSFASYIINELFNLRIPFGLRIGEKLFAPDLSHSHKIKLLKELALYNSYDKFKSENDKRYQD